MRTSAPPLLPVFRSRMQGDLLAQMLLTPTREMSITDLAARIDGSVAAVQREVDRLERAGILVSRRVGRTRLVKADIRSPVFEALGKLVLVGFGPALVMAEELVGVEGVTEAFIFGSWAERYEGMDGPAPADVDVLVIGAPDRDEVHEAALRVERRLGMPVNMTVRAEDSWRREASDGFTRQVRASALVPVPLGRQD